MSDYIKREDAKRVLNKGLSYMRAFGVNRCLTMIDEVPSSDVVEVVRCKDCMHYDEDLEECCHPKSIFLSGIEAEGFCHYGERKDD